MDLVDQAKILLMQVSVFRLIRKLKKISAYSACLVNYKEICAVIKAIPHNNHPTFIFSSVDN